MKRPKVPRRIKLPALLLVAVCLVVPFIHADGFRDGIREALQRALKREVEINGPVRLKLFPQPGFSASGVIIHDDPATGLEPLAYVPSLDVGLRLSSLWRRRLECSSLSLNEPSVNLVKSDQGSWNYPPLLNRALAESRPGRAPLPEIRVRAGRLNFKFGVTKSIFYFTNADVDISPSSTEATALQVRFSGEPARTDRPGGGFSTLSGAGVVTFPPDGRNRVALGLRLERSAISEVLRLLEGRGLGLAGFIASNARLEGEPSSLRITGSLEMAELDRRFSFGAQQNESSIAYRGLLNLQRQELVLESAPDKVPFSIRLRVSDYLTRMRWALGATLNELPLESLPALAREAGIGIPQDLSITGSVSGAFSLSSADRLQGQLALQNAAFSLPGSDPLRMTEGQLSLQNGALRLKPANVTIGEQEAAQLELLYSPSKSGLSVSVNAESLSIPSFVKVWSRLMHGPPAPLLSSFRSGSIKGILHYNSRPDTNDSWNGKFSLSDAEIPILGVRRPVTISSAVAVVKGASIQLRAISGHVGSLRFRGDYSNDTPESHSMNLHFKKLDADALQDLLRPALRRHEQGFIARTFRLTPPSAPEWLRERRVEATIQADELSAGSVRLGAARANLQWHGITAEFTDFNTELNEGGSVSGHFLVDLAGPLPQYNAELQLKELPWEGGTLDLEGALTTAGLGEQLLANLTAKGSFSGRRLSPLPPDVWDSAVGAFEVTFARGVPSLLLNSLEVVHGAETYSGTGRTAASGNLELVLTNESEQLGLSGTLIPLRLQAKTKSQMH